MNELLVSTPDERTIRLQRDFAAPRDLVFAAHIRPELVRQWLGALDGWSVDVCEIDFRVGGLAHYVWVRTNGVRMGLRHTYTEIVRPERIVAVEVFDGSTRQATTTLEFTEVAGRTTLVNTIVYESQEIRDAMLKAPMDKGVRASYNALDLILARS